MTEPPDGTGGPPPGAQRVGALLAAAALASLAAGCGGSGGDGDAGGAEASGDDTVAAGATDTTAATADSAPTGDRRPLRAFRFRITNEGVDTAVIVADAGAGARTLDTVPPADSGEVRVETRASRLELRARSGSGGYLARSRYDLERAPGDTLLDLRLPSASSVPDSVGG